MAHSLKDRKHSSRKHMQDASMQPATKDVSSIPTTSRDPYPVPSAMDETLKRETCWTKSRKYLYNKDNKTYCERTCTSWARILGYSIIYILFLSTYTLIFLYCSLTILKYTIDYHPIDKMELQTYSSNGIGLTAVPISEANFPLIWYKNGVTGEYDKYVSALDKLLSNRRKRDIANQTRLGPCANPPYGYGDKPCIVLRINKQLKWIGKPLDPKSSQAENAPTAIKNWIKMDNNKLWLHCDGYHSYDKEHIGSIKYYPDPPGVDPDIFPLDMQSETPLVALQISGFTLGVSLVIECKLWYDQGPSSVAFGLYVAPQVRIGE